MGHAMYIIDMNRVTIGFGSSFPLSFNELKEKFRLLGYLQPENEPPLVGIDAVGNTIELQVLTKESIKIVYDEERGRLTISNDSTIDDMYSEIESFFQKIQEIHVASKIVWFEINISARVLNDTHPLVTKTKPSQIVSTLESLVETPIHTFSRSVCSFSNGLPDSPLNKLSEWLHVTVGAFVPNPRYYQVRIVFRSSNLNKILECYKLLPNLILDSVKPEKWEE